MQLNTGIIKRIKDFVDSIFFLVLFYYLHFLQLLNFIKSKKISCNYSQFGLMSS